MDFLRIIDIFFQNIALLLVGLLHAQINLNHINYYIITSDTNTSWSNRRMKWTLACKFCVLINHRMNISQSDTENGLKAVNWSCTILSCCVRESQTPKIRVPLLQVYWLLEEVTEGIILARDYLLLALVYVGGSQLIFDQ